MSTEIWRRFSIYFFSIHERPCIHDIQLSHCCTLNTQVYIYVYSSLLWDIQWNALERDYRTPHRFIVTIAHPWHTTGSLLRFIPFNCPLPFPSFVFFFFFFIFIVFLPISVSPDPAGTSRARVTPFRLEYCADAYARPALRSRRALLCIHRALSRARTSGHREYTLSALSLLFSLLPFSRLVDWNDD